MFRLRYRPHTVRDLICASLDSAKLARRHPDLPEALVSNACLVARTARILGLRRYRNGAHVLRRMTAEQIARAARLAATGGLGDGGMEMLKKSLRVRRLSGCAGARATRQPY